MRAGKRDLRRDARSITAPTRIEAARVIEGISDWIDEHAPDVVLAFLPMTGEIDLRPLFETHRRIRWLVTRTGSEGRLTVHALGGPMERHRYGFLQPVAEAEPVDPRTVDLALVPGVLFDRAGGRLGHGAGYYDALLPALRPDAETIAVTLERRVVDEVPMQDHDVRIRWLATEEGVRRCEWPGGAGGAPPAGSG